MKILITGAGGFIGRRLVSRLSESHEALAVVRHPSRVAASEAACAIVMDMARALDRSALPSQVDAIIHLAQANVPFPEAANELFAVNTNAVQQLLDYGRRAGARQFMLASSGDVYGRRYGLSKETDTPAPDSYYAVTKYAAEMLAQSYGDYLLPCILRLYQPYGPGQSNRLMPKLAERIRHQKPVLLRKDDRPRMTPVYVDDVIRAIERAIVLSYSGIVNIAGDRAVSMRELAVEIGRALECEPLFEEVDEQSPDLMGDNDLMKQVLGSWDMIALDEGLSRTFRSDEVKGCQTRV